MQTALFVMPIKAGKLDSYKSFMGECLGPRKEDYIGLLKRYELNITKIWIHNIDGKNYAMFTHNMSKNSAELLKKWPDPSHPFDQWFKEKLYDCYDTETIENTPEQPVFLGEINTDTD
ncbi:MAG: hypothetical protein JXR42_04675 [Gammaproteobacteria bacterium]|nr:hypothetical protein [Gammaproteobacteria bacterium]